jgi:hypothetical protein
VGKVKYKALAIVLLVGPLTGCVNLSGYSDPAQRYERSNEPSSQFDRIHDNMDTRTYNQTAGAIARGDKRRVNEGLARLESSGSEFNRHNAGILRAVSGCNASAGGSQSASSPCLPK